MPFSISIFLCSVSPRAARRDRCDTLDCSEGGTRRGVDDDLKFIRQLNTGLLELQRQLDPLRGLMVDLHASDFMKDTIAAVNQFNAFAGPQFASAVEAIRELDRQTSFARKLVDLRDAVVPQLDRFAGVLKAAQFEMLGTHSVTQLRSELRIWERLTRGAETQVLAERAVGWAAGVQTAIEAAEVAQLREPVIARFLAPTSMLTRLTTRTARRIKDSTDAEEKHRLSASLELVEAHCRTHGRARASRRADGDCR